MSLARVRTAAQFGWSDRVSARFNQTDVLLEITGLDDDAGREKRGERSEDKKARQIRKKLNKFLNFILIVI